MLFKEKYINRIKKLEDEKANCKKQYNIISILRLLSILWVMYFVYYFIQESPTKFAVVTSILAIILFMYLLNLHNSIKTKLRKYDCMIDINKKYIKRLEGDWIEFKDNGKEELSLDHPYGNDLDIFGEKSLFQFINTTNTFYGRKKLVNSLKHPEKDINKIIKRQKAIKELGSNIEVCNRLECEGMASNKRAGEASNLTKEAKDVSSLFKGNIMKIISYILPVCLILSTIVIISLNLIRYMYIPLMIFTLNLILTFISYSKITPVLDSAYSIKKDIEVYSSILSVIEENDFESEYLKELKEKLTLKGTPSHVIIKKLNKIVDKINLKYSMLYLVINILFLWQYHCLFSIENWKKRYGKFSLDCFDTVGEFESLSSLAVLLHLNPDWQFPSLEKEGVKVTARKLGHPLIDGRKRIRNNVDMTNSIFIVTGSNMSGKTTFLRTIGINLVLAYAGAPVCANSMSCSIMDILTSMRISDDLNEGLSTFYAELKRIKIIIDNLNNKRPMIFLIDEIFKGTNSKDRIIGAENVVRNLDKKFAIGAISTHDFELCDLESNDKNRIKNYHFSESYKNDEIYFDYKLKKGRSDTTNAKYLMKMVGIKIVE